MAALSEVETIVRRLSRDFGTYFEVNFAPTVSATVRLPHPIVEPISVSILDNTDGTAVANTDYAINGRSGVVRFADPTLYSEGVIISGLYYQWFLDEDLEFYSHFIVDEHLHHRPGTTLSSIYGPE